MEIAALKVGDAYGADGAVRDVINLKTTKGGYPRRVFVNQRLQRALTRYRDSISVEKPCAALFPSQKGGHFSGNTMCQLFLEVFSACGMDGASSHSGRRTMITRLADQGISVHVLAAIAGHRNIATTQRYLTVNDALIARAVELL
jgi:integrase/recombinase XerD